MKNHLILFLLALCLPVFVFGQWSKTLKQIDQYCEKALEDWEVPGFAVSIVKDGKILKETGYGLAEQGQKKPLDEHSLFSIASNTKAFISTALGLLVEEGKISWEDKVIDYLPYLRMYDPYVSQHLTVEDLLCHRSGLGTFSGDVIWYKSDYTVEEVIRLIQFVPQSYEFRAGYGYSNLMYITAGEVIKAASGISWDEYLRQKIFVPLGMNETYTSIKEISKSKQAATPHKTTHLGHQPIKWTNWDNMGAAGGIISSVHDMSKWVKLQLDEGVYHRDTIYSAETLENLWKPRQNFTLSSYTKTLFPSATYQGYGLGWSMIDYRKHKMVTHSGGYDGMYSRVLLVPELELGIVVLTNSMTPLYNALTYYIVDRFMDGPERDWSLEYLERHHVDLKERAAEVQGYESKKDLNNKPDISLKEFAGMYRSEMFGPIQIIHVENRLMLHFPNAQQLNAHLEHWNDNTFEIKWKENHAWFDFGLLKFDLNPSGEVVGLQFDVPNGDIFFHEINAKRI